jgi:hypothetical protein
MLDGDNILDSVTPLGQKGGERPASKSRPGQKKRAQSAQPAGPTRLTALLTVRDVFLTSLAFSVRAAKRLSYVADMPLVAALPTLQRVAEC